MIIARPAIDEAFNALACADAVVLIGKLKRNEEKYD